MECRVSNEYIRNAVRFLKEDYDEETPASVDDNLGVPGMEDEFELDDLNLEEPEVKKQKLALTVLTVAELERSPMKMVTKLTVKLVEAKDALQLKTQNLTLTHLLASARAVAAS